MKRYSPATENQVCPKCEQRIDRKDLERRFVIPGVDGPIIEVVEHTKGRCGKWLWRPKEVAA